MSHITILFGALLIACFTASALGMLHVSRSDASRFNLDELLIDPKTGTADPARIVLFGSFILTTWMMVYLTINGKITEGYFTAYIAAWVAPVVAKIIWDKSVPRNGDLK